MEPTVASESDHRSAVEKLDLALSALLVTYDEEVISRSRIVNPLLEIWKLANAVDPLIAQPVERLLSVTPFRQSLSSAELREMSDEVHGVLGSLIEVASS